MYELSGEDMACLVKIIHARAVSTSSHAEMQHRMREKSFLDFHKLNRGMWAVDESEFTLNPKIGPISFPPSFKKTFNRLPNETRIRERADT